MRKPNVSFQQGKMLDEVGKVLLKKYDDLDTGGICYALSLNWLQRRIDDESDQLAIINLKNKNLFSKLWLNFDLQLKTAKKNLDAKDEEIDTIQATIDENSVAWAKTFQSLKMLEVPNAKLSEKDKKELSTLKKGLAELNQKVAKDSELLAHYIATRNDLLNNELKRKDLIRGTASEAILRRVFKFHIVTNARFNISELQKGYIWSSGGWPDAAKELITYAKEVAGGQTAHFEIKLSTPATKKKEAEAHSIALRINPDFTEYTLFDPNFGAFSNVGGNYFYKDLPALMDSSSFYRSVDKVVISLMKPA